MPADSNPGFRVEQAERSPTNDVMRFTVSGINTMVFVRRPISLPPPDGTICFVDDGTASGWRRGQAAGVYQNGQWTNANGKPLRLEPTYWTVMEDRLS